MLAIPPELEQQDSESHTLTETKADQRPDSPNRPWDNNTVVLVAAKTQNLEYRYTPASTTDQVLRPPSGYIFVCVYFALCELVLSIEF